MRGIALKAKHKRSAGTGQDRTGGEKREGWMLTGVSESSVTAVSPAAAIFRAIPP